MANKQLVQPDLAITEAAGWCLRFTERSFGVPLIYPTAWAAWQATQYKHQDRNFPDGVTVPVWFDWWGNPGNNQGVQQYGHAAYRTPDGKIHSAPGMGTGQATFGSVDELTNYFRHGMTYVGWSEDIAGVKVISLEGDESMDEEYYMDALCLRFLGRLPLKEEYDTQLGKVSIKDYIKWLDNNPSRPIWDATCNIGRKAVAEDWEKKLSTVAATAVDPKAQAKLDQIKAIVES
jgi:hypothetical protein